MFVLLPHRLPRLLLIPLSQPLPRLLGHGCRPLPPTEVRGFPPSACDWSKPSVRVLHTKTQLVQRQNGQKWWEQLRFLEGRGGTSHQTQKQEVVGSGAPRQAQEEGYAQGTECSPSPGKLTTPSALIGHHTPPHGRSVCPGHTCTCSFTPLLPSSSTMPPSLPPPPLAQLKCCLLQEAFPGCVS